MQSMIYTHNFSAAHRIPENKGRSQRIHGHNFQVDIRIDGEVADSGVIVDFDVIKGLLGRWLDLNWDHRIILCEDDPILLDDGFYRTLSDTDSLITLPYPPSAENMAKYLYEVFWQLLSERTILRSVSVYETETRCVIYMP